MKRRRRREPRRATLMVCVLVCLLVATAMAITSTQAALRTRRNVRIHHQMRQTELLLDAGILRAARKLRESVDYRGEVWKPDEAIDRFDHPRVEIRVTPDDQAEGVVRIDVTATLGAEDEQIGSRSPSQTRRSHRFTYQPSQSSSATTPSSVE